MQEQEAFDVDGNLVRQSRRLAAAYATTPDWAVTDELDAVEDMDAATAALLEAEVFTTEGRFDAMGRAVTKTTPDGSVLQLGYGDAGHLETVAANVRGAVAATSFVSDVRYDARGQRALVVYGNGTRTSYAYDPQTFRLTRLQTLRDADGHPHQDLRYTHDPAGNITEIRDLAQPIVFTSNAAVSADQRFEYDALYRLVHAEGREHGSQGQPVADDFVPRVAPDDPTGLRLYSEQYLYDAVGNILQLQHAAVGGSWTRHYGYDPSTAGNRLLATSAPGDGPGVYSHAYAHDAHGSMIAMPHLAVIGWDWADRMQSADLGGGGTVWFSYDAAGQRVRKLRVSLAGTSTWERIDLGGFELYRERVGPELRLERQTLHVGDDAGRVCLVETKTIDDALPIATPANVSRYQYGNHLGTVGLELDGAGQLISYEEFHPYGTTAYRAANGSIEVSASRHRYTGKERDEETGLGYHGARYYASWLCRWTAADPIGFGDGPNRFAYVSNDPVGLRDSSGRFAEPPQEVVVHSNRRDALDSRARGIQRDAAKLAEARQENRRALREALGPEGFANQDYDRDLVRALLDTSESISHGERQVADRRAELARDRAQLGEDEAVAARFRTTEKVVGGATVVAAALVGGALFAGHFGLQGVITAGRATLEADAAASGLPVTVAVTGKAAAHLADDAAGLVDDAVGLADDAVGATDDALRAAKGGIGAESLAGKCDASARALLEKIPGSRLQQAPPGKPGHFAVRKPDGTIVDETLRDNLMTYGAKVDDVPIEKTEFTEKEWFDLVDRFPNMADEIVAHFKDPFG